MAEQLFLFFLERLWCENTYKYVLEVTSLNKSTAEDTQQYLCTFSVVFLSVCEHFLCVWPSLCHWAGIIAVDRALLSDYTDSSSRDVQHE